ncbi:MAG: hypothetical protein IIC64_11585 [SAR324 cluster bacterium]|nr:hypothetical protein [SAR324 cluster bacterium]
MNQKGKAMNILKFIMPALAFLAVLFLVPGTSLGEISFKGAVTGGLGSYTNDGDTSTGGTSTTDIRGEARAYIDFHSGTGDVAIRLRYRVDEGTNASSGTDDVSGTISATRSRVVWKVAPNLKLTFAGRGFGVGNTFTAYGAYNTGHFGDGMILGDMIPGNTVYILLNSSGVDLTYREGNLNAGVGLLANCRPGCPGSEGEDQTIYVHGVIKLGNMKIGGWQSNATASDSTGTGVDASETAFVFRMDTPDFKLGFEYVLNSDSTDAEFTGIALGASFGPIHVGYVSRIEEDASGTETSNDTEIRGAFMMKISDQATLAFGYASRSNNLAGADETDTLIMVSAKSTF